jgi:hypothetical protein
MPRISAYAAAAASTALAIAVRTQNPVLRQDWAPTGFGWAWAFEGWWRSGIGGARAYPDGYLLTLPAALGTALFGTSVVALLIVLAIGVLCAFGARAVVLDLGAGEVCASASALFAVLNPWVYTELVAGHTPMLLAYGATIWFVREILRAEPRPAMLVASALLTLQQLQFFVVCVLLLAILSVARRRWRELAIVAVASLPIAIGIAGDRGSLGSIPFVLGWERNQSVAPIEAVQLNGYFERYADGFHGFFGIAAWSTFALALAAIVARPSWKILAVAAATAAALLFAMGELGPLRPLFTWAVEHVRALGLFRELYDVLGFAAIGYVVLVAATCARWRAAAWAWLAVVLLFPVVWIAAPPSHFWVASSALPKIRVDGEKNARFALVPAFQPISFDGRGSGSDPDAYDRANDVTPLNGYFAPYPIDAALSGFLLHGETRPLEALSVATVIERPWLQSDIAALEQQWALPFAGFPSARRARVLHLRAFPELALLPLPEAQTASAADIGAVTAPNVHVHADRGWVDARLAFAERPDIAQPFGGALTTDARATLRVRSGVAALVFVRGTLRSSDGRAIATTTRGYRWVSIPSTVSAVRCVGLCVVAAQGEPQPIPSFASAPRGRSVDFDQVLPWLAVATVAPGSPAMLRYNVAYDRHWAAYLGGVRLTHARLEGIVNGWMLPARTSPQQLVVVHLVSAAQFLAEILAIALIAIAAIVCFVRWMGAMTTARRRRTIPRATAR